MLWSYFSSCFHKVRYTLILLKFPLAEILQTGPFVPLLMSSVFLDFLFPCRCFLPFFDHRCSSMHITSLYQINYVFQFALWHLFELFLISPFHSRSTKASQIIRFNCLQLLLFHAMVKDFLSLLPKSFIQFYLY